MEVPLISILLPVFNGEPYLSECLDSILTQDCGDYELLLSDDASTDGSPAILARYAQCDKRVRTWRNPRNLGLGANFNACLRAARGRYIKYVLQDDKLLHASALRRMARVLESDPSVTLVVTASELIDEHSRPILLRDNFRGADRWEGKTVIARCIEQNMNLIGEPSLAMFRREQARRGFDESLKQLLDLEMWFHLLEEGRLAYLHEPLCAFREHPHQQTQVHRRGGTAMEEDLVLLERYYAKPWLKNVMTPQARFRQVYNLRDRRSVQAAATRARLSRRMGWAYEIRWVSHKLTRPIYNLNRSIRKRFARRRCA